MLRDFTDCLPENGIPSRLRADGGGEFNLYEDFMTFACGEDRMFRGPSVHNTRIERLWGPVHLKVLDPYKTTFREMEQQGCLNKCDQLMMSCLHHVYGPRIERSLESWRQAHNHHKMAKEEYSKTPHQLFIIGVSQNRYRNSLAIRNLLGMEKQDIVDKITTFYESRQLVEPTGIRVVLPRNPLPLKPEELQHLNNTIDVLRVSKTGGIDIYAEVYEYVYSCNV